MKLENNHVTKRLANSTFYFDRGYIIELTKDYSFFQISKCVYSGGVADMTKETAITKAIHVVDELKRREDEAEEDIEKEVEKELLKMKKELSNKITSICYKYKDEV